MKFKWDKKYLYWGITGFLVIVLSISFFLIAANFTVFEGAIKKILKILNPIIIGLVLAYLLNPIMMFIEKKMIVPCFKKNDKLKDKSKLFRLISLIVTLLLAGLFVFALFSMVIPQLANSIEGVIKSLPQYMQNLDKWLTNLLSSNADLAAMLTDEFNDINGIVVEWAKANLLPKVNSIIGGVTTGVIGAVIMLKDLLVGIIISVYLLYAKEMFIAQSKKVIYAMFSLKAGTKTLNICRRSNRIFGGFIVGKLIDSLIIGILCFIGMSLFKMPYPLLISVIIGITNIIPFFGPFIGAIPSGILVLMIDPLACLYFVIFIFLLQQFDGNILGPKILGDSTGLSAFWVIFAILIGGGLFGFVGMVIGVPAFALIYSIITELLEKRLKSKRIPVETKEFYDLDHINREDNAMVYIEKDE